MADFSEREAEVYDRQIRLWGIEAQRRMQKSQVLFVGLTGAAVETIKNCVLAGINVSILDNNPVVAEDVGCSFFFSADQLGAKRSTLAQAAAQELNPLVKVGVVDSPVADLSDGSLASFALVCASGSNWQEQVALDEQCRRLGIGFVSIHTAGLYANVFFDFGKFEFTNEYVKVGPRKRKVIETYDFPSIVDAVAASWKGIRKPSEILRSALTIEYAFASSSEPTADELSAAAKTFSASAGCPAPSDELLQQVAGWWGVDLSPVCAVIGGVVGQEIVNFISRKRAPTLNFFTFDGRSNSGVVTNLGASKTTAP